jgi:hypothetical protein
MKKRILTIIGVGALAAIAIAGTSTYTTLSDNGNAASPSEVIFPADPTLQIRIVNVNWNSDTNNAVLSFSGGSTAYSIVETNEASSSVTNKINSTNSLAVSSVLVLQHAGVCYPAVISSWGASTNTGPAGGTNVVLASGGWGVATSVGDSVYLMDTAVTIPIGATTNAQNGEAIYVAKLVGRPVRAVLTPSLATNKINSAVAHYE